MPVERGCGVVVEAGWGSTSHGVGAVNEAV